jgi:hypothetical protein
MLFSVYNAKWLAYFIEKDPKRLEMIAMGEPAIKKSVTNGRTVYEKRN